MLGSVSGRNRTLGQGHDWDLAGLFVRRWFGRTRRSLNLRYEVTKFCWTFTGLVFGVWCRIIDGFPLFFLCSSFVLSYVLSYVLSFVLSFVLAGYKPLVMIA